MRQPKDRSKVSDSQCPLVGGCIVSKQWVFEQERKGKRLPEIEFSLEASYDSDDSAVEDDDVDDDTEADDDDDDDDDGDDTWGSGSDDGEFVYD